MKFVAFGGYGINVAQIAYFDTLCNTVTFHMTNGERIICNYDFVSTGTENKIREICQIIG